MLINLVRGKKGGKIFPEGIGIRPLRKEQKESAKVIRWNM